MYSAMVSGIVTEARPVSDWPVFFLVPSNTPRSPFENLLFPVFFISKEANFKRNFCHGRLVHGWGGVCQVVDNTSLGEEITTE